MTRLEGSMATSGVRGHGERLLLSANEVGTWGSVSLRLCLSASPLCSRGQAGGGEGGVAAVNACQVTPMPSSLISAAASELCPFSAGQRALLRGGRGRLY